MGRSKPVNSSRLPANALQRRAAGITATALCEEAVHLLRRAPAGVFALYYAGSLPFWLGFLYFWADMSRDPFAATRSAEASLGVALMFLWMKCFHALAAERLRTAMTGALPGRIGCRGGLRLLATQAFLQGISFVLLPVAALTMLPLGFAISYFQNVTVLGATDGFKTLRDLHGRAARQSALWPGQSHMLLLILFLFAGVVAINLGAALFLIPQTLKSLTGVETVFTRSGWGVLNTTFFLVVGALTHLCVDPLLKTAYVLRCFYGESLITGEDLRVELAVLRRPDVQRLGAAAALALLVLGASPAEARGTDGTPVSHALDRTQVQEVGEGSSLSPEQLDEALSEVILRREFRWRLPRDLAPEVSEERGWFGAFIEETAMTFRQMLRDALEAIGDFFKWLRDKLWWKKNSSSPGYSHSTYDWAGTMQVLAVLLLGFVAAVISIWIFRTVKARRSRVEDAVAASPVLIPDVSREDVTADQLPEDGWIALARELMEKGELRLAMRALYLACLAALAQRGSLSIAWFKSNLDYEREVRRRSHARPELVAAFCQNVSLFDRSWYGIHEVTPEILEMFTANLQKLQSGGENA